MSDRDGTMPSVGNCRDCGAAVRWTNTVSGSRIAVNPLPRKVAMNLQGDGGAMVVREAFDIHFNTCTKNPPHRRTRR